MASEAQVVANRSNAQKSTGPRTAAGKAAVAKNAVKHGLFAQEAVIRGEDPGAFEFYRGRMLAELAPAGMMELVLAERAVGLSWRLRRAERVQNEVFDALYSSQVDDPLAKLTQSLLPKSKARPEVGEDGRDLTLGRVVIKDFANSRVLDRLLMYERRIENSLFRTMRELQQVRLMRELESGSRASEGGAHSVAGRLLRRCASRNDDFGDRTRNDNGRCGTGHARREDEARHGAKERAESDRLLRYSAAGRGGNAVAADREKQSQFACDQSDVNGRNERELAEICGDEPREETKPIPNAQRRRERANMEVIAM
jgi:hypothetical protein